jgi:hypothetical protein
VLAVCFRATADAKKFDGANPGEKKYLQKVQVSGEANPRCTVQANHALQQHEAERGQREEA